MFKRADVITVDITGYAFGGKGVAKVATENGEYVIFVDNSFPGQKVKARIAKKRKRYAEAKLLEVFSKVLILAIMAVIFPNNIKVLCLRLFKLCLNQLLKNLSYID